MCALNSFLLILLHLSVEISRLHLGTLIDRPKMANQIVLQLKQLCLLTKLLISFVEA